MNGNSHIHVESKLRMSGISFLYRPHRSRSAGLGERANLSLISPHKCTQGLELFETEVIGLCFNVLTNISFQLAALSLRQV
jgi:hypothetical protein